MKGQSKKLNPNKLIRLALSLGFLFLAFILISPCAYALKVQSGTVTITNTNSSVTEAITAVSDINKAFLLMWSTGDSGTDRGERWQATGYLSATNEITFERADTVDDCQISYYVIEAEYDEFSVVKRGAITIGAAATTGDAAIGATIDQTRSFVVAHSRLGAITGGDANNNKGHATAHFIDNTNIRATRSASGTYTCVVRYEVIEWAATSGVSIQSKEYSAAIGTTEVTDSITTAVTPGQTWLYATARHSSNGLTQSAVDTYLKNGTTVGFKRKKNSYTSAIRWWAIEFPSSVSVEHKQQSTAASSDLTVVVTLASSVTLANSFSDMYNNSNGTGKAFPRQAWYTELTSTSQITNTRYYNGQTADLSVQAIDTSSWAPPPTPTANSVITTSVAAGASDILIFDATVTESNGVAFTITDVTLDNVGTAIDAEITSLKLYYDSNNSNDYTSGVDQLAGSGTFSSGSKTFSGLSISVPASGNEDLYVVLDLANSVTDGNTLDVKIPANGITYSSSQTNPTADINSTGIRTIDLVLDHFVLGHDTAAIASIAENIIVTAKDDQENTLTDYTGTITMDTNGTATTITWANVDGGGTFVDGGASVDTATYTYIGADNGAVTLSINDTKSETINISSTGDTKTDDDTEGNLVVSAGAIDHFVISHDTAASAGVADNVVVTAKDSGENTITDYTGTITLDTDGTVTTITWTKLIGGGTFLDGGGSVDTATYTYIGADSGTATFTINDTTAESLDISVSGDSKTDDDTEGNLVVAPDVIDYFVISHDTAAVAGIADNVSVTAKDQYANTKTDYTGQITLDTNGTATTITWANVDGGGTFLDGGASVDTATYTYIGADNGAINFTITDTKTETINISATGDAKTDDDTEGNLVISPAAINSFVISHDGTGVTDVAETVTVTAKDTQGNTKDDYTGQITVDTNGIGDIVWTKQTGAGTFLDGGGGDDTATYTYDSADNGVVVLTITDDTGENLDIDVSGDGKTDDDSEGTLNIVSSGIDHFVIAHDNNAIASVAENVTITAKDANEDTITTYQGTITLDTTGTATTITWANSTGAGSFVDGGANVDTATYTFDLADNGVVTLTLNDTTEETINISATGSGKTDDDTEGNLVINPTGLHHFILSHDGNASAGVGDNVTITAKNANEGTVTSYTGTITADTNGTATAISWTKDTGLGSFVDGGSSVDTATYTYVSGDNGVCILAVNDTKVETINISVTGSGKSDDDSEGTISVGPGAIDYFVISHDNAAIAGTADNVSITAYDAYDNLKTDYTGQITVDTNGTATTITWANSTGSGSFVDGGASVDTATYTYVAGDSGTVTLTISDTKTETINISSTGDTKTDDDSEGNLVVGPTAIDHFVISHDNAATAGTADNVSVTAYDAYNNLKDDYTGQITVDTNGTATTITWANSTGSGTFLDGGASVDTATYTYVGADNGAVTLTIIDTKVETLNVAASGDSKTDDDTEGNLVVSPASIDHFIISHDNVATAGTADNVSVTAYDAYSNLKDDYTGQITVDTNGTATTITWANSTGSGTFLDGGASVDTATYTYVGADNGAVTLTINDTAAETIDIDAAQGAYVDDDTEGDMVVSAASIDHFIVGHDNQAVVNSFEPVTVTAKDQYENTLLNYTGQITLSTLSETGEITWSLGIGDGTFVDNGGGVDTATYTYTTNDNGLVTLNIKDDAADQSIDIEVSGDTKTDDDTEGTMAFSADSIIIDNLDADYSESGASWATKTGGSNYIGSNWRRNNLPTSADYARWTPTIDITGNYEVSVSARSGATAFATNAAFTVNYEGGTDTYYMNQESGGGWEIAGTYKFISGTSGYVQLDDNADDDICADAVKWVLKGSASASANVVSTTSVAAGDTDVLILDILVSNNTDTADTITAVTVENSGTAADNEISSVKLYYDSDNSGTYTTGVDSQVGSGSFASGSKTFSGLNITLLASGTEYLFAIVDIATTINDADTIDVEIPINGITLTNAPTIEPSALNSNGTRTVSLSLDHFVLSHDTAATAGVAEAVSLTAKDQYENTKTSYTGIVTLDTDGTATTITWANVDGNGTFVDGGGSVDTATYTYVGADNGAVNLTINDTKAETLDISVSGDSKTDDDTEGNLVVSPGGLDHFVISHDTAASAGVADNVTVTAKDANENTISNYTGQIILDTNGTATTVTWALLTGFGTFLDGGASVDTATYTFSSSDNSTATFTISDTKAESLNISSTGDAKTDDDTEGNLVVSATILDHFVITHDAVASAGVADNVTITAKDQYENTKTLYTGQITMDTDGAATTITWANSTGNGVFNDGGASVDTATYTYDSSDNGAVTLTINDTTIENLNISSTGDTKTDDDTEGTLNVGPGAIDHFAIGHDGFAQQNQAENISITAYDAYSNIKDDYTGQITLDTDGTATTITWANVDGNGTFVDGGASVDTATYTYVGADNGVVNLTITDDTAEIINISSTGDGKTDDDNEGVLDVVAAGFHHFTISHDNNAVESVAENITITAKDVSEVTVTNYSGVMTVDTNGTPASISWALGTGAGIFNDGGAGVDTATYDFDAADNGVVILTITDTAQETINISAAGSGKTDDDTEGTVVINPAGIDHFTLSHDLAATAGIADNVIVTAEDANHSTVTDYTGTINLDTNGTAGTITWANVDGGGTFVDGGGAVDTATYTYVGGDNGAVTLSVNDTTAESINISVSGSGKTDDDTEGNLVVSPNVIDHFVISHDSAAEAGVADSVTVTAKDQYENTLTNYASQITMDTNGTATTITWALNTGSGSFVDGGASVDTATYTYVGADNGVVILDITDTTVEDLNISSTGDAKTDDDTEGNLSVGAGAINYFKITHDSAATAGTADNVTVTAYDTYDNVKSNYTGTITMDTDGTATTITWANSSGAGTFNDGGASVDTATYTYVAGDSGTVTFTITDTKAESLDIDISGSGKFDDETEGNLVVSPAGLSHFTISHDSAATAGTADNVIIYARDTYENNQDDYTGQITLDTDGTATTITWANVDGNGTFVDGGASVDTATYTYVGADNGAVTLSINDTTTDTLNISVSGDSKFDDDTEGNLVVSPDILDYFVISHDNAAIQSIAESITVTAKDQHANTKTDYTSTITLDTNGTVTTITWALNTGAGSFVDGGAPVDTATYTYNSSDNGVAIFDITDSTAETINVSVADGTFVDENTEGNLVVQASTTTVDATANALNSGYVTQGSTDNLVLDLTLTNNDVLASDTMTSITIDNAGTITDAQVSSVKLYYDSNNSGDYTSGVDQQIGVDTFTGGTLTFSNLSVSLAEAGTEEIFVVVDLDVTVTDASTVDVSVPVNGISFSNAPTAESSILNSTNFFTVDSLDSTQATNLSTTSHNNATSAWNDPQSRDNTVYVSWSPATDSGSGLDGYSVLWDNSAATLPDTIKDIEDSVTSQTSAALSDGNANYFHIRSVDNVGNWDDTAQHLGPFYIDTTGPASTSIYQISELAGGDYLYVSGSNTIYYSGLGYSAYKVYADATDTLSGLKEASFPSTNSSGGTDTTEAGGSYEYEYIYQISGAGSSYNDVDVTVYDIAGNWNTASFSVLLDNTVPNTVSNLASSSHTPSVPSSDNDVIFTWSDVTDADSGILGYSFIVDTDSNTNPPKVKNINTGVGTYTANDLANGSHYAHIRAVDNVGNWSSSVHAGPYIIGRGSISSVITSSKSVVSTDQDFTVTMTVTNDGGANVNNVDPSTLTVNSIGSASASTVSNPSPQNITPSSNKQYQWTYTAGSSIGTINFQGYAQGSDSEGTVTSSTVKSPDITVENKASLTVAASASPSTANTSETITITVTMSNTGTADALGVAPSLTPSGTASPTVDTGPSPSSATIIGGQSKQFTFTGQGTASGTATFTADISTGTDENSGNVLSVTSDQDSITISLPSEPEITSSFSVSPTAVDTLGTITVTMSVQNTGSETVTTVAPSTLTIGGTSSDATLATGPIPASVASLTQGSNQDFVWTYTAGTTLGTVNFTGNATSDQANSSSNASSDVTIQAEAAALSSSITVSPNSVLTNANITVTMTVNNTAGAGGATANSVVPSLLTLGGTSGEANLVSGPTPTSVNISAGANQDFVWTYKAGSTIGTVNFTGNATGSDANSQTSVSSTSNSSSDVTVSSLSPEWMYPASGASAVGAIRSVPIAFWGMDNRIYFGSDDNNLYIVNGDTHLLATSITSSGSVRGLPFPNTEDSGGGVFKDIVYYGTLGSSVYARWENGSSKWSGEGKVLAGSEELSTTVIFDYVDNLYFGTNQNRVYSISATTGNDDWVDSSTVGGAIESSPAMIYVPTLSYDEVYFGASDGKLYGFKAADGTGARTFDTGFGAAGAVKTAPAIGLQDPSDSGSRRLLFFGSANGRFYAVNTANMSASTAETGWTTNPYVVSGGSAIYSAPWIDTESRCVYFGSQDGKVYALSLTDGTMKTNFPVDLGSAIDSWPLVYNGIVYVGADDGKFYAIDVLTGQIASGWPYDTGGAIKGGASLHLIYDTETWEVIDTSILIGSDSGRIYAFTPADE